MSMRFARSQRTIVVCVVALLLVCAVGCESKEKNNPINQSLHPTGPLDEEQIQSIAMKPAAAGASAAVAPAPKK